MPATSAKSKNMRGPAPGDSRTLLKARAYEQLKADIDELRGMTPEQCEAFRAAAGVSFQYSIGSPHFSSGHKAACCLGRQVLGWLNHGRLSDEDRAALATCTRELGIRLERERAVVRTVAAGQIAPNARQT